MKKLLLLCVAALFAVVTVSAQTAEEWQASLERLAKLEKLETPKATGIAKVDELLTKSGELATESMTISLGLHEINKYLSSGNPEDMANVDINKLTELGEAAAKISTESIPEIAKLIPEVAEEVKGIKNPLKAKGALSAVNYSKTVVEVISEESVFQVKTIAAIIEKIKE